MMDIPFQVACNKCHHIYPGFYEDQAMGCASYLNNGYLECAYGSAYDMDRLKFTKYYDWVNLSNGDIVCDDCIESMLYEDRLIEEY